MYELYQEVKLYFVFVFCEIVEVQIIHSMLNFNELIYFFDGGSGYMEKFLTFFLDLIGGSSQRLHRS